MHKNFLKRQKIGTIGNVKLHKRYKDGAVFIEFRAEFNISINLSHLDIVDASFRFRYV